MANCCSFWTRAAAAASAIKFFQYSSCCIWCHSYPKQSLEWHRRHGGLLRLTCIPIRGGCPPTLFRGGRCRNSSSFSKAFSKLGLASQSRLFLASTSSFIEGEPGASSIATTAGRPCCCRCGCLYDIRRRLFCFSRWYSAQQGSQNQPQLSE